MIQFSLLVAVIFVLAGAYFGIRSYNTKQTEKEKQAEEDAKVVLTSFQPEDVTAISYDYNGTTYEFTKSGETWQYTDDQEMVIDEDVFESFLQTAGSITVQTEVEPADDTEDYGLEEPIRTVTVSTEKGTSSIQFGMKNEMLSQYYVKTSESSKIYLADESVYTAFDKTAADFEETDTDTDDDETNSTTDADNKETNSTSDDADDETNSTTDDADDEANSASDAAGDDETNNTSDDAGGDEANSVSDTDNKETDAASDADGKQ